MMRARIFHPLALSSVALIALTTLSACVGPPASQLAGVAVQTDCPVTPLTESLTLRLAHQPGDTQSYIVDQKVVEACLPQATVEWTAYSSGQDIVQAMASGSADVGWLGTPPASKALSGPINLAARVTHISVLSDENEALVSLHATSVKDLVGGRIGVGFSSTAHYHLLKTLEAEGLVAGRDVEVINLSPDHQVTALSGGEVDAIFAWDPTLGALEDIGAQRIITAGELAEAGAPTYVVSLATDRLIEAHPQVTELLARLDEWSVQQYRADPESYIQASSRQSGNSIELSTRLIERRHLVEAEDQEAMLRNVGPALADSAQFFAEQGQDVTPNEDQYYVDAVTYGGRRLAP